MSSKRGTVSITAMGENLSLRVSTNAMVSYQDETGETFVAGLTELQADPSNLKRMRGLFCSAMSHIDGMTPARAGDIMDDLGLEVAISALSEAAELAFPPAEDTAGNAQGPVPAPNS